jgi:ectoine hydroxylase-related dioxygenase (phytanoyl-CoA dioxygenase family)
MQSDSLSEQFVEQGYIHTRNLISRDEVDGLLAYFTELHREQLPGHYEHVSIEEAGDDILRAYPRVMNPHRYSDLIRGYMTDFRIADLLRTVMGEEPLGAQSMLYFKPPGARGQAMHQDQFYLAVSPGTCVAVWIALDRIDRENGGLVIVPKTGKLGIDCSQVGKPGSYDKGGKPIRIPAGFKGTCPEMESGDALIFNGSLIHGSGPNKTKDRWRRSLIFHYAGESCSSISRSYHPLVRMDGQDVERAVTTGAGAPCGNSVTSAH